MTGNCVEEFEVWEDEGGGFGDAVDGKEDDGGWEEGYDVLDAYDGEGVGFHAIELELLFLVVVFDAEGVDEAWGEGGEEAEVHEVEVYELVILVEVGSDDFCLVWADKGGGSC